jgi:pyruvate/2-oxoglutarate/acetoin dehydrogenase E1 component
MSPNIMTFALRTVTIAVIGLVTLTGWQLYSTLKESDSARKMAAHEWALASSSRSEFLALFEKECGRHLVSESERSKPINRPLSFKECLEQLAFAKAETVGLSVDEAIDLGSVMDAATDRIVVPAPLRWL